MAALAGMALIAWFSGAGHVRLRFRRDGLLPMINNFSILFSIVAVFWVGFRAIVLDRKVPWFGTASQTPRRR